MDTKDMKPTDLLLFDGRHLLFRAADVHKHLSTEIDGESIRTGGIYGFLTVLLSVHTRWNGLVGVAWEGENNFRCKLYPKYKQKSEMTEIDRIFREDLNAQEKRLRKLLSTLGIRQWSGKSCEADDVLGTIATRISSNGRNVIIYTGDSDLRQLVSDKVVVVSPGYKAKDGDKRYTKDVVFGKHGVYPEGLADFKALAGDSSDNIPGVRGIGPKKASALVNAYGDVVNVIAASQECEFWPIPVRFKQLIQDEADNILLYKELTKIKTDVELIKIGPEKDNKAFIRKLNEYKFTSLVTFTKLHQFRRMAR